MNTQESADSTSPGETPRFKILQAAEFVAAGDGLTNRDQMAEVLRYAATCLERGYPEGAARRVAEVAGYLVGQLAGKGLEGVDFPTYNGGQLVRASGGTKTALYRHFDGNQVLLYVGISLSAVARLGQHMGSAHWALKIARVEVEWFPTRELALAAEKHAIQTEMPLHNIVHSSGVQP